MGDRTAFQLLCIVLLVTAQAASASKLPTLTKQLSTNAHASESSTPGPASLLLEPNGVQTNSGQQLLPAIEAAVGAAPASYQGVTQQRGASTQGPSSKAADLPHANKAAEGDSEPHVKPLWPLDGIDFAVLAVIMFSLSLAGGAGIGGGAILVPVFLMLRGWPTAIAVALSNVTILGGSFANFICNVARHRPNGKRTIDWELILMMEPTTIAGALVGAVANKLLPNWFITYLLAILLTLMALRLYSKGKQTYAKETQLLAAAHAAAKERALERQRLRSPSASLARRQSQRSYSSHTEQQGTAAGAGGVPVPASRQLSRGSSYRDALGRSLSRLRGSLVVDLEPGTSILSPTSGAGAPSAGSLTSGRHRLHRSITAGGDGSRRDGVSNGSLPSPALEHYIRSTLFQGDADVDSGVVVALSAYDELSPVPSADSIDLEDGFLAATGDQDVPELAQPLLGNADRSVSPTGSDDIGHGHDQSAPRQRSSTAEADKAKGSREPKQEQAGREAPDLTIHLGDADASTKEPIPEPSLPLPHLFTLLGLSAWVVAADILQDSFRCGSWQYWLTQVSVLVPVITILAIFREILLRKYHHDDLPPGHELPDGELHWTKRTTILYPLLCSTAGLIAGLFGIGGGVVKGPLMLELGVPADVAAATSATMIMFTAGSACLVYSRFGHILYDYAAVLIGLGFFITLCSQLLTFLLIKLFGRRSIIVFMMVALMAAATGIMYVQSGIVTADLVQHPEDLWDFGSICPAGTGNLLKQLGQALLAKLH